MCVFIWYFFVSAARYRFSLVRLFSLIVFIECVENMKACVSYLIFVDVLQECNEKSVIFSRIKNCFSIKCMVLFH